MASGRADAGSVVSLWRYPVKSMMGEQLNAVDVTERGLLGDRVYALMDSTTGVVASAKNPRKFASLFDCLATFAEPPQLGASMPPVRIMLPDGTLVTSTEREAAGLLSAVFERQVTLVSVAPEKPSIEMENPNIEGIAFPGTTSGVSIRSNTFFDFAPVHLLTTATLDRLREKYPQGRFEVRRFRPNIVVEPATGLSGFVENDWIGKTLIVGDTVRLKVVAPCPRCVMTTLSQGDLPRDPGILRAIAQHTPRLSLETYGVFSANVGVYASVLRGGRIRHGDSFRPE
jgi:uncharacterized protein YcbX